LLHTNIYIVTALELVKVKGAVAPFI